MENVGCNIFLEHLKTKSQDTCPCCINSFKNMSLVSPPNLWIYKLNCWSSPLSTMKKNIIHFELDKQVLPLSSKMVRSTGSFWEITLLMEHGMIYCLWCVMHCRIALCGVGLEPVNILDSIVLSTVSVYF